MSANKIRTGAFDTLPVCNGVVGASTPSSAQPASQSGRQTILGGSCRLARDKAAGLLSCDYTEVRSHL